MNGELLFLRIISQALAGTDRPQALRRAFAAIRRDETHSGCRAGESAFARFMAEVRRNVPTELTVERNGICMARLRLHMDGRNEGVPNVLPGAYRVLLGTGRIVWAGVLTRDDLIEEADWEQGSLRLAAATEEPGPQSQKTLESSVPGLTLRLSRGSGSGFLEARIDAR